MQDSYKSVEIMQKMQDIVISQSESMEETRIIVGQVLNDIRSSKDSIELIRTVRLNLKVQEIRCLVPLKNLQKLRDKIWKVPGEHLRRRRRLQIRSRKCIQSRQA